MGLQVLQRKLCFLIFNYRSSTSNASHSSVGSFLLLAPRFFKFWNIKILLVFTWTLKKCGRLMCIMKNSPIIIIFLTLLFLIITNVHIYVTVPCMAPHKAHLSSIQDANVLRTKKISNLTIKLKKMLVEQNKTEHTYIIISIRKRKSFSINRSFLVISKSHLPFQRNGRLQCACDSDVEAIWVVLLESSLWVRIVRWSNIKLGKVLRPSPSLHTLLRVYI